MKIITIHQPNFLPYLGFFDKCDYSDVLVLYNSTQFKKNDFQNRNKLRTKNGWVWLTVPVSYKFGSAIKDVQINNVKWKRNHIKSIELNYAKSDYYHLYIDKIKEIYNKEWLYLADLNIELIRFFLRELGINVQIVLSNELEINTNSTQALVDICKKLSANEYISGIDGKKYLKGELFDKENIKVIFQDYQHPTYQQAFDGFQPYMSILDLLFNHGQKSLNIIKSQRKYANETQC
jgi:hypothetical protein